MGKIGLNRTNTTLPCEGVEFLTVLSGGISMDTVIPAETNWNINLQEGSVALSNFCKKMV